MIVFPFKERGAKV